MGAGRTRAAIAHLQEAVRLDPNGWCHTYRLGVALAEAGENAAAADCFRRYVEVVPRIGPAWMRLAQAVGYCPENAGVWAALGVAYAKTDQHLPAVQAYRLSLRWHILGDAHHDSGNPRAHLDLGLRRRAAGRCRQAQRALARARQLDPLNALIVSALGVVLALQKKLASAEKVLRQAVRLDPSFGGAWHNLGLVLKERGRRPRALAAFEKATRLVPDFAPAWVELGDAPVSICESPASVG